jgi:hypothetical protein
LTVSMPEVDVALRTAFEPLFGATVGPAGIQRLANTENSSPARRSASSPEAAST